MSQGPTGRLPHSPRTAQNLMPQSLAKVYLHVIFSTKNRAPLLADEWRDELFNVLGGTANNLDCQSLIVGGVADHVHMLFQLMFGIKSLRAASAQTALSGPTRLSLRFPTQASG